MSFCSKCGVGFSCLEGFGGFLLRMWDGCLAFGAVCAAAAGIAIAQKLRV